MENTTHARHSWQFLTESGKHFIVYSDKPIPFNYHDPIRILDAQEVIHIHPLDMAEKYMSQEGRAIDVFRHSDGTLTFDGIRYMQDFQVPAKTRDIR